MVKTQSPSRKYLPPDKKELLNPPVLDVALMNPREMQTMRAENAPVYATKQTIRLPRTVSSMGYDRHALERSEEGNHSDGLASVLAAESSAVGGGEPTSPALSLSLSRAASALNAFACVVDSFSF